MCRPARDGDGVVATNDAFISLAPAALFRWNDAAGKEIPVRQSGPCREPHSRGSAAWLSKQNRHGCSQLRLGHFAQPHTRNGVRISVHGISTWSTTALVVRKQGWAILESQFVPQSLGVARTPPSGRVSLARSAKESRTIALWVVACPCEDHRSVFAAQIHGHLPLVLATTKV